MKTIVLLDIHKGGHHLMYLRIMSKTLLEMGYQVIAFCLEPESLWDWVAADSPQLTQHFKVLSLQEPKPVKIPVVGRLPQPFTVLARWFHARQLVDQVKAEIGRSPDLVFFNWIDSYLSAYLPSSLINQVFPYPWAGLCFQPQLPLNPSMQPHRGLVNFHAAFSFRYCRGVGVLDEGMATQLRQQTSNSVIVFPDVTDESAPDLNFPLAQKLKAQANKRKIIGLIGSLNRRKGLLTLLEAALRSPSENWLFAFVGQLSTYTMSAAEIDRVQAIVASAPSNCLFHLERIPDEPQFNALVEACDVLFAAYENFPYSSNLLTKAAVFSKPVIVSQGGCMGEQVKQFQLGVAIAEGNVDQCIAALQQCDQSSADLTFNPDFAGYRQQNSIDQLRTALQELLANV